MLTLTYLGHSGFILQGEKGTIAIDPFLTGNPLARKKPAEVKADYILLSHAHGDHLGDSIEIATKNDATIVSSYELCNYCGNRGAKGHGMNIGGAHQFPFGKVKLTIAHHGSSTPEGDYMGEPSGFIINMDGKTIYHAGDTALFYDMKLIGEMNRLDLALLPIGDNFTMGIDDAVKAAEFLGADLYVPMHYNTFDVINADPQQFLDKLAKVGRKGKVLGINESLQI